MHTDRGLGVQVTHIVDVVVTEGDGLASTTGVLAQSAVAGRPYGFGERAGHDGEGTGRSAMIVELGALIGGPADEPYVDLVVAVEPHVPALLGVGVDFIVAVAHVLHHGLGPFDQLVSRQCWSTDRLLHC